jgi:YfiH family protein
MAELGQRNDGNVQRDAGSLTWFEPVEPLAGIARVRMTTRVGGVSQTPYASLNLGTHVGDVEERVRQNRVAITRTLGRHVLEPVVADQVHGTHAQAVGELHAGTRWQRREETLAATDALVTHSRYLPLVILVADCLPIALVDPERQVVAAIHAGWRGLAGGVIEAALERMNQAWGTLAQDVVAWIGPGIGSCCYQVSTDVAAQFPGDTTPDGREHARLDLRAAAQRRLRKAGVVEENLTGLDLCTSCHEELFFSHRRATTRGETTTGRQALIVWLDPPIERGAASG